MIFVSVFFLNFRNNCVYEVNLNQSSFLIQTNASSVICQNVEIVIKYVLSIFSRIYSNSNQFNPHFVLHFYDF